MPSLQERAIAIASDAACDPALHELRAEVGDFFVGASVAGATNEQAHDIAVQVAPGQTSESSGLARGALAALILQERAS